MPAISPSMVQCCRASTMPLTPGDTIGVQHQDKKARFTVVTTRNAGLPDKTQVELRLVKGQECPWAAQIPSKPVTRGILTPRINSKRRFERLPVPFPIEIRDHRGGTAHADQRFRHQRSWLLCGVSGSIVAGYACDHHLLDRFGEDHHACSRPHLRSRRRHGYRIHWPLASNQGRVQQAVEKAFTVAGVSSTFKPSAILGRLMSNDEGKA